MAHAAQIAQLTALITAEAAEKAPSPATTPPHGVAAIVASSDSLYLAELDMDYVGFAKETTQTMLAHLRTQPVVLNEEKRVLRRDFFRPSSNSPNMNLQDFTCELDKRQQEAEKKCLHRRCQQGRPPRRLRPRFVPV